MVGLWLFDLIHRLCGSLHSDRIVDQVGLDRRQVIQGAGVLPQHPPPLGVDGLPRDPDSLRDFAESVTQQVEILTASDTFVIFALLTSAMIMLVLVLHVRTLPPRLLSAKKP